MAGIQRLAEKCSFQAHFGAWKPTLFNMTVTLAFAASAHADDTKPTAEQLAFFENKIRPLLADNCLECHSAAKRKTKGGLRMDNREDMLRGGENGTILVPGNPADSAIIAAVEWRGDTQMPPKKHLSAEQISALKTWIAMGAPDPREKDASAIHAAPDHWSFKPITAAPVLPEILPTPKERGRVMGFINRHPTIVVGGVLLFTRSRE